MRFCSWGNLSRGRTNEAETRTWVKAEEDWFHTATVITAESCSLSWNKNIPRVIIFPSEKFASVVRKNFVRFIFFAVISALDSSDWTRLIQNFHKSRWATESRCYWSWNRARKPAGFVIDVNHRFEIESWCRAKGDATSKIAFKLDGLAIVPPDWK